LSEVTVDQHIAVVKEVSVLRGHIDGVKEKQNEQREDIAAINEKIETLRRDVQAGFEKLQAVMASNAMNAAQLALSQAREQGYFGNLEQTKKPNVLTRTGEWVVQNPTPTTIIGVLALALAAITNNPSLLQYIGH